MMLRSSLARSRCSLLTFLAAAVGACQGAPNPVHAKELHDWIEPGMSCAKVESRLGPPVFRYATMAPPRVGDDEAWYLPPPELDLLESPYAPGTIGVVYNRDNMVVAKKFNPQWKRPNSGAVSR